MEDKQAATRTEESASQDFIPIVPTKTTTIWLCNFLVLISKNSKNLSKNANFRFRQPQLLLSSL